MKRFAMLVMLTGCLDSLVDNPCEDGYTLVEDECVVDEPADPDPFVVDPEAQPPVDPAPPTAPPTTPPALEPQPPDVNPPLEPELDPAEPADGLEPCPTCR